MNAESDTLTVANKVANADDEAVDRFATAMKAKLRNYVAAAQAAESIVCRPSRENRLGVSKRVAADGVLSVLSALGFFKVVFIFNDIATQRYIGKHQPPAARPVVRRYYGAPIQRYVDLYVREQFRSAADAVHQDVEQSA